MRIVRINRLTVGLLAALLLAVSGLSLAAPQEAAAQAPPQAQRPGPRGGSTTATPTPTPTPTPRPTATPTLSSARGAAATPSPTATPRPTATAAPRGTPRATATPAPAPRTAAAPRICYDCDPCLLCDSPDPTPPPQPTPPPPAAGSFNVMTWNIAGGWWFKKCDEFFWCLTYYDKWVPDRYNLGAVADVIRERKIDIAILQEVRRNWDSDTNWDDQVALLQRLTGMYASYAPNAYWKANPMCSVPSGGGDSGLLVLSRFPIASEWSSYPAATEYAVTDWSNPCRLRRSTATLQEVDIKVAGSTAAGGTAAAGTVRVYNLHNTLAEGQQEVLPNHLLSRVTHRPAGIAPLAGGDYNCKLEAVTCFRQLLNDQFRHVCEVERAEGPGTPGCDNMYVDHLFVWDEVWDAAPQLTVWDAYIHYAKTPSDHSPLVAQVSFNGLADR